MGRRAVIAARWLSTSASAGLVLVYALSLPLQLRVREPSGLFLSIGYGQVSVGRNTPPPPWQCSLGVHGAPIRWRPAQVVGTGFWLCSLPLWWFLPPLAGTTACVWVLTHLPKPGHCPRCGYNLAGLTTCPECGP